MVMIAWYVHSSCFMRLSATVMIDAYQYVSTPYESTNVFVDSIRASTI